MSLRILDGKMHGVGKQERPRKRRIQKVEDLKMILTKPWGKCAIYIYIYVCVCVCVRVRACVRACVYVCVCVYKGDRLKPTQG